MRKIKVALAAKEKGVTTIAIRKAIERGDLTPVPNFQPLSLKVEKTRLIVLTR